MKRLTRSPRPDFGHGLRDDERDHHQQHAELAKPE
jgi:hypothetical protein